MRKSIYIIIIVFIIIINFILNPSLAFAGQATLSLSPSSGTLNVGCSYPLQVLLDTGGGQTDGTDAILIYDTSKLSATLITQGSIYPEYPGNNIDDTAGRATISGLASVTQPYSGQGLLGTVNFTVKSNAQPGATQINFDFDPADKAKTTDSNVVEHGTVSDLLNSVVDGNYTIGTGSCVGLGTTSSGAVLTGSGGQGSEFISTPSGDLGKKSLDQFVGGKTGSEELTYTVAIIGTTLTILGIIGLAIL